MPGRDRTFIYTRFFIFECVLFSFLQIYLMYMYHSTLPSPFNLFPNLSDLTTAFTWICLLGKSDPKLRAGFSLTHCCYIVSFPSFIWITLDYHFVEKMDFDHSKCLRSVVKHRFGREYHTGTTVMSPFALVYGDIPYTFLFRHELPNCR